jgi:hypothetical protein
MIRFRIRHRLFNIAGVGQLTGQGTRVRPRTQLRGIQRDGDEHKDGELGECHRR